MCAAPETRERVRAALARLKVVMEGAQRGELKEPSSLAAVPSTRGPGVPGLHPSGRPVPPGGHARVQCGVCDHWFAPRAGQVVCDGCEEEGFIQR